MASGGGDASNIPGPSVAGRSAPSAPGGGDAPSASDSTLDMNGKPVQAHYEELAVIGTGAYGTVYKARDLTNEGAVVALKKVRVELTEDGVPASTLREIALLKQLDQFEHPNVVKLLDVCHGQRLEQEKQLVLYLVFEHVEQDLACYLERVPPPGLPLEIIKSLSKQILNGVDFLHMNRIVHRDLKPQNLLVSSKGEIKIADFGLAKTYDFEMRLTSIVVTLWYRAPEILMCQPYATPVDIWSIGCIMAEMYRRRPLFCGTSEGDQLDKIFEIIGTPSESDWPKEISIPWKSFPVHPPIPLTNLIRDLCPLGNDLLSKMLKYKGQDRITAAEAMKHDYFKDDVEVSSPAVGSTSTS